MVEIYDAKYCSLHVRETNEAAKHLYKVTLQFKFVKQHVLHPALCHSVVPQATLR